ncbi:MAG: FAD-dependent oxidoreductase [Evtepia gabavorous]
MELGEPDESGRRRPVPVEGKFETLPVTCVISAIGQKANVAGFEGIELNRKGIISADETSYRTSMPGVFAVGDATNQGASIAIEAIGEARRCANGGGPVPQRHAGTLSEDLSLGEEGVS